MFAARTLETVSEVGTREQKRTVVVVGVRVALLSLGGVLPAGQFVQSACTPLLLDSRMCVVRMLCSLHLKQ